jgi:opacity protein-like surface antigen
MKLKLLAAVILLALSSCAKRPDAIVPVDIPMAAYSNANCVTLGQDLLAEQDKLSTLSKQQNQAATGDALGVFLIGVPASSTFGGDKEGEVAVSKGKVNAIQSSLRSKGCK